ncbi:MAG TPA: hypothetical protein DD761_03515 [Cyanobacteria bacterium UBA11691]|nr:hypothetical protein [Cyanobacteria bacterium UBA11691]
MIVRTCEGEYVNLNRYDFLRVVAPVFPLSQRSFDSLSDFYMVQAYKLCGGDSYNYAMDIRCLFYSKTLRESQKVKYDIGKAWINGDSGFWVPFNPFPA